MPTTVVDATEDTEAPVEPTVEPSQVGATPPPAGASPIPDETTTEPAEPTEEPVVDDPNADAPVELVEAAGELPDAVYAMASATTAAEVNIIGISWDTLQQDAEASVYLRTSEGEGWGGWQPYETEQLSDEADRVGSDPIVVLGAGVEVQAAVTFGEVSPADATLLVVDPLQVEADELATEDANGDQLVTRTSTSDDNQATTAGITRINAPQAATNMPVIYSRADWGADESQMKWTPQHGSVKGVVVHHTAGGNGYTAEQVPGIIRGIYYYHAVTLGWGDMGYNVLVDTYGRLWEGRAGGLSNAIVGGHALEWNSSTFGISVLGNFSLVQMPQASMDAMARAIAWKFGIHNVSPTGSMSVGGVTKPAIIGHRDVASTECPGNYMYPRLGELRTQVGNLMSASTNPEAGKPEVAQPEAAANLAPYATNGTAANGLLGYDPNFLISDSVMYTPGGTMTTAQVQSFLNTQGASCVKGNDGSPCLKNATFNTPNRPVTKFCANAYTGRTGESAAAVIANSAKACGVNAQVLLTILQKEQGLITTTDPTRRKYDQATGFGCPDFQECNTAYEGFVHQVYSAASQLQRYRLEPNSFTYRVGGTFQVAFNPSSSCGTAQVTMKSAATAALYNYTPYVANKAALDAVSGTGDSCSAYGNRNFYRNFNLWFGRPNADAPTPVPVVNAPPVDRDFFRDGRVNVVAGTGASTTVASVGPARQLWEPRTQIGSSWPSLIAPGDWNGDGRADAMLVDGSGLLWLYPMGSNGRFQARIQIGHGWQNLDQIMAGVDWDGDGKQDLLGRQKQTGAMYLYRGDGHGGFASARLIGSGWGNMTQLTVVAKAYQGRSALRAVHADGRLFTYPASNTGGFINPVVHGGGWGAMVHIAGAGDWSADGVGDLLAVRNDGMLYRYDGISNGNVRAGQLIGSGWTNWRAITVAQQSKAHSPLWGVDASGDFYEYRYTWGHMSKSLGLPNDAIPFAGGDWDGNGQADVIYRIGNGDLMLSSGLGSGSFAGARRIGNGWQNFDQVIAVGSWRGDGLPALATYQQASGEVRIYFGDGRGAFTGYELIGTWPGAKSIFAVGQAATGAYPTIGLLWQDGTASYINRTGDGTVGASAMLARNWGNVASVVGGFDTDGTTNREFLLVLTDRSARQATSTSGLIASERQVAPAGSVALPVA
ncbi:MAG: N-acetylmuramoyl-L-alanine amidase [Brooklawnia sp.]